MSETKYNFRELKSSDVFPMFGLLNKIGFREFKECFQSEDVRKAVKDESALETIGIGIALDVAGIIVKNFPACENEIYNMLANVSDLSREQLENMGMVDFFEMIVQFITKEEFKDFIKVVSKLFK